MGKLGKLISNPVGFLIDSRITTFKSLGNRLEKGIRQRHQKLGEANADTPIGVIMTAYNTGHLIEQAAQSILSQTHENLELWILDDASTDNTPDILKRLAEKDGRVKAFRSPKNHGTYWSKNWCLSRIQTPFVAFQDSDDVSLPHRLRQQVGALIAQPKALAVLARWNRMNEAGKIITIDGRTERLAAISLMIRRGPVLKTCGYFDTVRISADTEYLSRLAQKTGRKRTLHLREVLYHGLIRGDSLTRGPDSGFHWTGDAQHQTRELTGDRLTYHEAFKAWHRGPKGGRKLAYIDFPQRNRAFPAPASMLKGCDDEDMDQILSL